MSMNTTFCPQLKIGAVCQQWRQIMWSNPRFWNIIHLRVTLESRLHLATVLKEWVFRSGELPLFFSTQYHQTFFDQPPPQLITQLHHLLLSIISTLNTCIHRWSLVNLSLPKSYMTMLRDQMSSASTYSGLKGLALSMTPDLDEDPRSRFPVWIFEGKFNTSLVLRPQELSLEGFLIRNVQVDAASLTSFKGMHMLVVDCLELVRRAPQLVDCDLEFLELNSHLTGPTPFPPAPILHTSIQRLRLADCPDEVLNYITFPELWSLIICNEGSEATLNELTAFIKRSECCLQSFDLRMGWLQGRDLLEFLKLTPALLDLDVCPVGDDFFEHLGRTTFTVRGSPGFLPQLQTFSYYGFRTFQWSSVPLLVPPTQPQDMAKRPLRNIVLQLNSDSDDILPGRDEPLGTAGVDIIDEASVRAISNIVNQGIRIQITDSLDLIDASMKHHGIL
ncbi:hypothetical protein CPB83DRAFT_855582 [Crepidotus variabilis]|uniref:F-box domain-containing protein n=1 Tax=Crepidotus variabilis TaxID=179855 RepID=A0A9P6EF60_9AGAR|nr:hypothetical protein CPB83DRAFT_855582 [Crepidotus variabilis]